MFLDKKWCRIDNATTSVTLGWSPGCTQLTKLWYLWNYKHFWGMDSLLRSQLRKVLETASSFKLTFFYYSMPEGESELFSSVPIIFWRALHTLPVRRANWLHIGLKHHLSQFTMFQYIWESPQMMWNHLKYLELVLRKKEFLQPTLAHCLWSTKPPRIIQACLYLLSFRWKYFLNLL